MRDEEPLALVISEIPGQIAETAHLSPCLLYTSIQNHYHMFEREQERELIPFCNVHNVGILPYFPLAGGFLTGKYRRGEAAPSGSRGESSSYVQAYMTDANFDKLEALEAWANARGYTPVSYTHLDVYKRQ